MLMNFSIRKSKDRSFEVKLVLWFELYTSPRQIINKTNQLHVDKYYLGIRKGKELGYQNSPHFTTTPILVTSHTFTMIDNIAKPSVRSVGTSEQPSQTANSSSVNRTFSSPVRGYSRHLVVPNAPKIERRRCIPLSQFSITRRNIFYFAVNEE